MRVIAGRLGGRQFNSPHGHKTHPMSDKIRGALFNTLGDIKGLTVLDAFSGSGALSFEAISRGANAATAIDNDSNAQRAISENIKLLGLHHYVKPIKAGLVSWLATSNTEFDLIFCDPPYDNLQLQAIQKVSQRVKIRGLLVVSLPPSAVFKLGSEFSEVANKDYGDAKLVFYRRIQ